MNYSNPTKWGKTAGAITVAQANKMVYPWKNRALNLHKAQEALLEIANYTLTIENREYNLPKIPERSTNLGRNRLIVTSSEDYMRMNFISDLFMEDLRIQCTRFDQKMSTWQNWIANKKAIIAQASKTGRMTVLGLNDVIYTHVLGCGNFRSSLVAGFIDMYQAKSMLDISSGWGDRLIGAISKNIRYVGYDPNTALVPRYKAIINTLVQDEDSRKKFTLVAKPFERTPLPDPAERFDMVFSSPPFFNLENYSDEETQSMHRYKEYDAWMEGFLYPALDKAWDSLNSGGYMVINMNNVTAKQNIVGDMITYMNDTYDAPLYELFGHREATKKNNTAQPILVWRKLG